MLVRLQSLIALCLIWGIFPLLFGQIQEWVYTYNGPTDRHDRFCNITYGADGNTYLAGWSDVKWPDFPGDFIIISFGPGGNERWFYRYSYSSAGYPACKIIWGGDGNVYAVSSNLVISLTPAGVERWVYSGASGASSIAYGSDGNLYLCGDNKVISLSTAGTERWTYSGVDWCKDIVYGSDGSIYVAGAEGSKFTVASLTSTGTERWVYSYSGSLNDDLAYSIISNDGNIYAAGRIKTNHYMDLFVVSLTAAGVEQWTYKYSGPGAYWDCATDMTMGLDGNLYVTGKGGYGGSQGDIIALSLTASGNKRWFYDYNGPGNSSDCAYTVSCGLDGNIYITGESIGFGSYDVVAISLTQFGNKRWVYRYDGGDEDAAWFFCYGLDGKLYICGDTYRNIPTFNADLLLIKLDPGVTGISDISTNPAKLIFDYSSKEFDNFLCPSKMRISSSVIDQNLVEKMKNRNSDELVPIIIQMTEQLNAETLQNQAIKLRKPERRAWVSSKAKLLAQNTQKEILAFLESEKSKGKADGINSLWIVNSISAEVTPDVLHNLSKMQGIYRIWFNGDCFQALEDFVPDRNVAEEYIGRGTAWGVDKIRADSVWINLGYTGKGIIIGVLDTGVRWSHDDLKDHMWEGGTLYPYHGWNFVSDNNSPADDNGHGTHVAGTIAGDGTAGTQTGVAPDAQIMVLKVLNSAGSGSIVDMARAIQFAIDHNTDAVNLSMGAANPSDATKDYCRDMSNMAYAADLPMAIAAGNGDGTGGHYAVPNDIYTPGDAPTSWYGNAGHSACIAVGATDAADNIASFSSYGPTQWNTSIYTDYPYPPGLIKPDVSAPGVNITSLDYFTTSGYINKSGTSMATPHLTGTIALMLEKNRFLTCREIDSIIETTAIDFGVVGRDNNYGAGRIDALDAVWTVKPSITGDGTFYVINSPGATANLEFDKPSWKASWIKDAIPASYAVGAGQSTVVVAYVDTTGLAPGTYWDTLWISSNDPDENPYPEPVTLILGATGISFSFFTADAKDDGVLLTWRMESETSTMEWLLERSLEQDDNYSHLTTILGNGTTPTPTTYNWFDDGVEVGNTYYYKLGDLDLNGNVTWYGPVSARVPNSFGKLVLRESTPNPFKGNTLIRYHLPRTAFVNLSVYDVTGRLIRKIAKEEQKRGWYSITWDGKDNNSKILPSGIYYCRLSQGNSTQTRKILLVK